jgi:signal peptidase II
MSALCVTLLVVLVSDQALKLLLRRRMGSDALALGPFGSVRVVAGRLWLRRLGGPFSGAEIWCLWSTAAVPLINVCLRFWPAFNLADLALAAGAIGIIGQLLIVIPAMVF